MFRNSAVNRRVPLSGALLLSDKIPMGQHCSALLSGQTVPTCFSEGLEYVMQQAVRDRSGVE